ncbi:Pyruvate/2-oxoacid:ferredoxin oxidoreductase delta subunit [Methanohalophilus levihalophilus]|uniref:4Fe-4S binding protein n=1 Tax=Methanohalophilus levihalophilus TaxID=1431282 RepID=UPI001AE5D786|nr:Pyruvate/2-oxoacid:ferredoxin oxidoreductase delta subunit [Methanohalophilus levihalophilus]
MKITARCVGCGQCTTVCNQDAIEMAGGKALITDACTNCKICMLYCPMKAIEDKQ